MAKFIFLYRGPATPMEDFTPEQGAEVMAAWNTWIEASGSSIVEVGNPFGARTAVAGDGTTRDAGDLNGYSVVEADSLDAAVALTEKHPFLSDGTGSFAIEVFELAPM